MLKQIVTSGKFWAAFWTVWLCLGAVAVYFLWRGGEGGEIIGGVTLFALMAPLGTLLFFIFIAGSHLMIGAPPSNELSTVVFWLSLAVGILQWVALSRVAMRRK